MNADLSSAASACLAEDGTLALHIPGFAPRRAQQEMAADIARTLEDGSCLVCEAGTGTGKTFAYLVPALLSGKRVMISTGTRTLQDQLFHRDLPTVRKALARPVQIALLKGRANYLCLFRLKLSSQAGELFPDPQSASWFEIIKSWAGRTRDGDIAEVTEVPENAEVWRKATSTTDNCLGQKCPDFQNCFLLKARRKANDADVLVVNHYLFFADMALRDEGFGELLPGVHAVIFDEAHQLAEAAAGFFGIRVSSRQLLELCQDTAKAEYLDAGDCPQLVDLTKAVEHQVRVLHDAFGEPRRAPWNSVAGRPEFREALAELRAKLDELKAMLEPLAKRGENLENCARRTQEFNQALVSICDQPPADQVAWFEVFGRGYVLSLTPLDVAPYFQSFRAATPRTWIFTSATLAVGEDFSHFHRQLGLDDARGRRWPSPFDFRHAALFYLPQDLPEPSHPEYTHSTVEAAVPVLQHSRGRAFFLFTSHRALLAAAELLEAHDLPWPLLVQGSMPRGALLERFRELGNAILLGTGSFWEGVDVRGEALSCVIIDKLPFASPGDPVLEARLGYLRRQGANPFMDYQIPQAVISLKQGSGRLIRDISDRGLLMICDPRMVSKPYGRIFLDSLPPMPKTRKLEVVERFFVHIAQIGC